MKKPRKISFGTHVGTSLILLIFMVLCLVSFATLSLVNASADRKLTVKLAERQDAYYAASHMAEGFIAISAAKLKALSHDASSESEYLSAAGELELSAGFPLSEEQELRVSLTPVYGDELYIIDAYEIVTVQALELDETLPLYHEDN